MISRAGYLVLSLSVGLTAVGMTAETPERQMNVRQGPESVFERQPAEVIPELEGAKPTSENGRIGNELVFWGFELAGGRNAYLSACAPLAGIDCDARLERVCPADATVLRRTREPGKVRELKCRYVRNVAPGDVRPGCTDRESEQDLVVTLIQCR